FGKETVGGFTSGSPLHVDVALIELGRTILTVVSVARNKMHKVLIEQKVGVLFGAAAENSEEGLRGHLYHATILNPLLQIIEALLQKRISFGMRNDRHHACGQQLPEDIDSPLKNGGIGELHQQIAAVVDRVLSGM